MVQKWGQAPRRRPFLAAHSLLGSEPVPVSEPCRKGDRGRAEGRRTCLRVIATSMALPVLGVSGLLVVPPLGAIPPEGGTTSASFPPQLIYFSPLSSFPICLLAALRLERRSAAAGLHRQRVMEDEGPFQ